MIDSAEQEVLLMVSAVTARPIADALRRSVSERRVNVYVLTDAQRVFAGGSFVPALTLLDTFHTRLGAPRQASLVIDRRYVVEGPLVTGSPSPLEQRRTVALDDPALARTRAAAFLQAWRDSLTFEVTWDMLEALP